MSRQQRDRADKLATIQKLLAFRKNEALDNWGNMNLPEEDRTYWLGRLEQVCEIYSALAGKIVPGSIPNAK